MAIRADTEKKSTGLDLVRLLLRRVSRGFYHPKHSILLDIVLKHSAIRDDHLAQMMGVQNQEARKLCGRLKEDRVLTMHTRQETKEGQNRPIHRTYYFIDYRDAVDAVKYRMHKLVRTIEEQSKNDFDSKGYVCPYCQRRYGALDVLSLLSYDGQSFQCIVCQSILVDDEESMESKLSQERLSKLQRQTKRIVSTLKDIDNSFVPDNDFISAFADAVPPALDMFYSTTYPDGSSGTGAASNTMQTTTSALEVRVDYDSNHQDNPEETSRKLAQAEMNQLPDWHLHSTVSGHPIAGVTPLPTTKSTNSKVVQLDAVASDEVAEYYRSLRAQQQAETDSEDGEDFEDVPDGPSAITKLPEFSISTKDDADDSEDDFEDL